MKLVTTIIGFFVLAQLLGIFTGLTIISDINMNPYVKELMISAEPEETTNAFVLIGYILVGALFMMILIRLFSKHPIIFILIEFALISSSSSIVFYAFLRLLLGYEISTIVAVIMGLLFSSIKMLKPQLKNAAAILATAGVGVIFGVSFGMVPVVLFLIMLSVYDYLSVFTTKHMVELANFVVKKNLAFTVTARKAPLKKGEPEKRMDLGTGDMIAPIMLEVSALAWSPVASLFIMVGAVVSLLIFLDMVWKKKMVLPALPPIVLGMMIALVIGFILGLY